MYTFDNLYWERNSNQSTLTVETPKKGNKRLITRTLSPVGAVRTKLTFNLVKSPTKLHIIYTFIFNLCGTSDNELTKERNDGPKPQQTTTMYSSYRSSERHIPPKQQLHTAPNYNHATKVPRNNLSPLWRWHVIPGQEHLPCELRLQHYVEQLECAPGPPENSTYQHMRRAQPSNSPVRASHLVIFLLLRCSWTTELLRTFDSSVVLAHPRAHENESAWICLLCPG
jgi:hypothetical protein